MYELMHARGDTYYIDCPAKIGLYVREDGHVFLIDGGSDKEAGKKVLKVIQAHGWTLDAVVVTHSHADHFGGCAVLQERTGCRVYGCGAERAFMQYPVLEPAYLFGGFPPAELRNKFLMAKPCAVRDVDDPGFPPELAVVPLPGHYFAMVGVMTPDKVFFCADCLSGERILAKYHVTVLYDVAEYLATLERVSAMDAELFVPAHADPVREVADRVLGLCGEGRTFEEVLAGVFALYGLSMDFIQYVLVGSTVRSYLAYLRGKGAVDVVFAENRMLWVRR